MESGSKAVKTPTKNLWEGSESNWKGHTSVQEAILSECFASFFLYHISFS